MPELKQIKPKDRSDYATGFVKSLEFPKSCLSVNAGSKLITLEPCSANNTLKNWTLTYINDLRVGENICAEVQLDFKLGYDFCHSLGGRQSWHYDAVNNHLVSNTRCLE
ncbi:hypothetical protein M5D96_009333, partial [Drosophila gunungcola]